MRWIAAPLCAIVLLAGASTARTDQTTKYTCAMDFPDGTAGVAVVNVIMSAEAAAPTVMVTVDYYDGSGTQMGRYEDWSSSSDFPTNEYEAEAFALAHFNDRW